MEVPTVVNEEFMVEVAAAGLAIGDLDISTATATASAGHHPDPDPDPLFIDVEAMETTDDLSENGSSNTSMTTGSSTTTGSAFNIFDPCRMAGINNQDDMEAQLVRFKIRQMEMDIVSRIKREEELNERVENLEAKQEQRHHVISCIYQHWTVVNTELLSLLHLLLGNEAYEATTSILNPYAEITPEDNDDQTKLNINLTASIQASKTSLSQIMFAFDQLNDRRVQLIIKGMASESVAENEKLAAEFANSVEMHCTMAMKMSEVQDNLSMVSSRVQEYTEFLQTNEARKIKEVARSLTLRSRMLKLQEKMARMKNDIDIAAREKKRLEDANEQREMMLNSMEIQLEHERAEMQQLRLLQDGRLVEIETMNLKQEELEAELKNAKHLCQKLKKVCTADIMESESYRQLQTKFSVVFNELVRVREGYAEARKKCLKLKAIHEQQVMEMQKRANSHSMDLESEVGHMQNSLKTIRKEYSAMLEKYTPNKKDVDQNTLISREMRNLVPTLQDYNQKMVRDVATYNGKCVQMKDEIENLKEHISQLENAESDAKRDSELKIEIEAEPAEDSIALIESLQAELNENLATHQEMKLRLDMNKSIGKDQRSLSELMELDSEAKAEKEELEKELQELLTPEAEGHTQGDQPPLTQEQATKQIAKLEAQSLRLQESTEKALTKEKELSEEMELRGQNFDNLQGQNLRLTEELNKVNKKNMWIMVQGNKIGEVTKQHWEKTKHLHDEVVVLNQKLAAGKDAAKQLEEKTKLISRKMMVGEQEGIERWKLSEKNRMAALENIQAEAELQETVQRVKRQWEDVSEIVSEKETEYQAASDHNKAIRDKTTQLRHECEDLDSTTATASKEKSTSSQEQKKEQMQRKITEYKMVLTCPSCKVARKDAYLSTCFHVFCYECLRALYASRNRKCPQCARAFGAEDYHRLKLDTGTN